jgi:hypothetical protein
MGRIFKSYLGEFKASCAFNVPYASQLIQHHFLSSASYCGLRKPWKESAVGYFKVGSQRLPEATEKETNISVTIKGFYAEDQTLTL